MGAGRFKSRGGKIKVEQFYDIFIAKNTYTVQIQWGQVPRFAPPIRHPR
jgi:hypothetical protein